MKGVSRPGRQEDLAWRHHGHGQQRSSGS